MNVGDKIPEILGIDQNGKEIKASDYKGRKIILYSYPKANTSGCTAEACSLQSHKAELESAGFSIIGVSKDKQEVQKKFADAFNLEFPLIADTETTLLQNLGCWGEKVACGHRTIGILRTTYLVDEEGVIFKIFRPEDIKTKIHAEQILEQNASDSRTSKLADVQMKRLREEIMAHADPSQVAGLSRFFKTGPGEYGEGDKFLGIKVPVTRSVVKECWRDTDLGQLRECIRSEYHEVRLAALLTLVQIFAHAKKDKALQQQCVDFYLGHLEFVNNWDLVDLSCYEILGRWLLDKDRRLLYDLARDGKTIWEQRIGIVSTMQFIRHGQLDDTYGVADIFLEKPQPIHDLLQKAVGWLLRDAGKRDEARLRKWLEANSPAMPRTMLRYAIEKFPEKERLEILGRSRGSYLSDNAAEG